MLKVTITLILLALCYGRAAKDCGKQCISARQCPASQELEKNIQIGDNQKLLVSNFCGYKNRSRYVCCDDLSSSINSRMKDVSTEKASTQPPTTTISPTTKKAGHPNLRLLPKNCGEDSESRIINGKFAKMFEFPWMAIMAYTGRGNTKSFHCSGTLITNRYVLTAAHCLRSQNRILEVRLGEYDLSSRQDCQLGVCETHLQNTIVEEQIIHPKYRGLPNYEHDIALLRLMDIIDLRPRNINLICLPVTDELRYANITNEMSTVAGWGLTEFNRASNILRKVDMPILSKDICQNFYSQMSDPENAQLCAGEDKIDSCTGDSGGPLMLRRIYYDRWNYVQYGIVSAGLNTCGNSPGQYTDVRKYVDWILDNIRD